MQGQSSLKEVIILFRPMSNSGRLSADDDDDDYIILTIKPSCGVRDKMKE
jgi:hypothetical protein